MGHDLGSDRWSGLIWSKKSGDLRSEEGTQDSREAEGKQATRGKPVTFSHQTFSCTSLLGAWSSWQEALVRGIWRDTAGLGWVSASMSDTRVHLALPYLRIALHVLFAAALHSPGVEERDAPGDGGCHKAQVGKEPGRVLSLTGPRVVQRH